MVISCCPMCSVVPTPWRVAPSLVPSCAGLRCGGSAVSTVSPGQITHQLRCRAMALSLPAGAVITGRSAATIRGVPLCWPDDDVQVLAPPEMRLGHRAGLIVRRTGIEPVEWEPWAGGRIATPMRLALDLLLGRALPDAVADLDAVLRARLVEHAAIATMVAQRSDNGIVVARRAVELTDPSAESLPESKPPVHLVLDGLAPVPQYWIHDAGGRIARVDLAQPEYKIAIEYDGDWRDGPTTPRREKTPENGATGHPRLSIREP